MNKEEIGFRDTDFSRPEVSVFNSEVAAAWAACALDGEGLVGVYKAAAPTQSGSAYCAKVVVTNNDLDFLAKFNQLVGGRCKLGTKPKVVGHKQSYRVQVPTRIVVPFLLALLPYMIVKRKQALMVLAFRNLVDSAAWHGCANHEAYERIYQECKALNARGE